MLMQFVFTVIPVLVIGIISFLAYIICKILFGGRDNLPSDLRSILKNTSNVDGFLMFVLKAVVVASAMACSFCHISKHTIISLDIVYFISILILIMFHTLKIYSNPLCK